MIKGKSRSCWIILLLSCVAISLLVVALHLRSTGQMPTLVAVKQGCLLYYKGEQMYRYDPATKERTKTQPEYSYARGIVYHNGEKWVTLPNGAPAKALGVIAIPQAGQVNIICWEKGDTTRTRYIVDMATGQSTIEERTIPEFCYGWVGVSAGEHLLEYCEYHTATSLESRRFLHQCYLDGVEISSREELSMIGGGSGVAILTFFDGEHDSYALWDGEQMTELPEGDPLAWTKELYFYFDVQYRLCCYQITQQTTTEMEVQGKDGIVTSYAHNIVTDGRYLYCYDEVMNDDRTITCWEILCNDSGIPSAISLCAVVPC